ncbi:hypothetical protein LIER_17671 [Lithospermum erythrorhizon]|uniref:Uncharacterized protein n=1 Tax=Lithospermum erythrorhizon TaxID=34254 RepID=A0AAV3QFB2_LITER
MSSSVTCGVMNPYTKSKIIPTCKYSRYGIAPPTTKRFRAISMMSLKMKHAQDGNMKTVPLYSSSLSSFVLPLAASVALILWSAPANAGFLSGSTGLESMPGPELPRIDFLNRWNDENQKKYAENDARFKESPLLKKLLEKSQSNKEKNKQAIQDKYCLRGAEWGVGDCSAAAMTPEERDSFIAMLKQKAGVEE